MTTQAAATLAATVIGFDIGLYGSDVVNAVMVVVAVSLVDVLQLGHDLADPAGGFVQPLVPVTTATDIEKNRPTSALTRPKIRPVIGYECASGRQASTGWSVRRSATSCTTR